MKILFGLIGAMIAGGIVSVLGVESAAFRGIAAAVGLGCGWLAHGMLEDREDRARIARELEEDRIRYEQERVTKAEPAGMPKVQPKGSSEANFHEVVSSVPVAAAGTSRLPPMEQGFTQEELQDLISLGAFHYEALLREKNLVNDGKGEIIGVVPYGTWEVFMLAGLCDLNLGQLNERLKGLESPSWESLLSTKVINPRSIEDPASLNVRRRYLPNAYIRSKATIVGALAFSKGAQEFDAWRSSVVVGLNYDEANKVEPYLREVFENVQKLVRDAPKRKYVEGTSAARNRVSMNRNQRIALIAGAIALLLMLLFPPWRLGGGRTAGYHFLFLPPDRNIYIDFGRLFLQCLLIAAVSGGIFLLLKSKEE